MSNRIVQILQERGITKYRLSKETGIPPSSITDWTKNGRSPTAEKLAIVAEFLNVSVDYLLGNEEKPTSKTDELSKENKKLIEDIMKLPVERRQLLASLIRDWQQD